MTPLFSEFHKHLHDTMNSLFWVVLMFFISFLLVCFCLILVFCNVSPIFVLSIFLSKQMNEDIHFIYIHLE